MERRQQQRRRNDNIAAHNGVAVIGSYAYAVARQQQQQQQHHRQTIDRRRGNDDRAESRSYRKAKIYPKCLGIGIVVAVLLLQTLLISQQHHSIPFESRRQAIATKATTDRSSSAGTRRVGSIGKQQLQKQQQRQQQRPLRGGTSSGNRSDDESDRNGGTTRLSHSSSILDSRQNRNTTTSFLPWPWSSSASTTSSNWQDGVPEWVRKYVEWHVEMRRRFPGRALLDHPDAPKLLIRTCLGLCGGLNDRIGQLPWDLYLANRTNRLLLLHWHRPLPLENFLLPNVLDWSVPREIKGFFVPPPPGATSVKEVDNYAQQEQDQYLTRVVSRNDMKLVRNITDLFEGYPSDAPNLEFWKTQLDEAIRRATTSTGKFQKEKLLRHRLLGHIGERYLEDRLRTLGEIDMIHRTPTFGNIFRLFFRPSPALQAEVDDVYRELDVVPGKYTAAHCRVRHPKATPLNVNVRGKDDRFPADRTGLPWTGEAKATAIRTATRALQCAKTLSQSPEEPIYFYADSSDLVQHVTNSTSTTERRRFVANSTDNSRGLAVLQIAHIVSRNVSKQETVHIDRQKGRDVQAYLPTFVDLIMAINARCVTYGVGYYAVLATKISGTTCTLQYQKEAWGSIGGRGEQPTTISGADAAGHHSKRCLLE